MKKINLLLCVLLIPAALVFFAYSSGSPGGKTGSPGDGGANCTDCHTGDPDNVTGWIIPNIPTDGYDPGQTYDVTAIGNHPDVVLFGFELTVEDGQGLKAGTLNITDPLQTQLTNGQNAVTHTSDGNTPVNNQKVWNMSWTAPAEGTGDVVFYASFNAGNGDGTTSGDVVYLCDTLIEETAPPELISISPNTGQQGQTVHTVIVGDRTSWTSGEVPTVNLVFSEDPAEVIPASSVTVNTDEELEASFPIPSDASLGLYDLQVNDLELEEAFTVITPQPMLTGIDPDEAYQTDTIVARISGSRTNFTAGVDDVFINFHDDPAEIIVGTDVEVLSDGALDATFNIPSDASVGMWDVNVDELTLENGFEVLLATVLTEPAGKNISVYPNPAVANVYFEAQGGMEVRVFSSSGHCVDAFTGNDKLRLDVSGYAPGLYLIHIQQKHSTFAQKLLVN